MLRTHLLGSDWLTGGSFGPEAGPITLVLCLAVSPFLLRRAAGGDQLRRRAGAN